MSSSEKVVVRGRKNKETSLECLATPLKKKRGRKPRSSSPPLPDPGSLSFFKVLIGDFRDVLFIPPMVACTLKGLAKKYCFIEDVAGRNWNVKMSMVDGSLAFQNGWHDFVSDHSITVGEFVLFTYIGELLFSARIFGTNALERVDFQMKGKKSRCSKKSCTTELKPVNVRISKRKKICQASEEKHIPSSTEVLRSSRRKKKSVKCEFPKIHVIESDSTAERVLELSRAGEKPFYDLNSKESEIALHDSEQTLHRNSDVTVGEQNVLSPTERVNSDIENIEAVASRIIRNKMLTTDKEAALLHSGGTLRSKQTAEEPDAMIKTATCAVKAHSDIKMGSTEMSGSLVQMNKEHDEMRNNGKIEQDHSHDLGMLDSELHDDKMTSLSNLEHAECNPKMEFNVVKSEGITVFFLSADGICHTTLDDEKLIELATGASFNTNGEEKPLCQNYHANFCLETSVPCETVSAVSSNPILDTNQDKKENLMSISEEQGVPQGSSTIAESWLQSCNKVHECKYTSYPEVIKRNDWQSGIADDAFLDEDEKIVTPCSSRRCRVKIDRTDSVDIPLSCSVSFSICLSDDVQSSLELPKKMGCQIGKLKHERKVVVLQDQSMRFWPVLYHKSKIFVGFIGGWVDFAKANNICRGDTCEFQLINKMEFKFRVQITKAEGSIFDEKVS
uniref:B3 domain-containing protein Os01g0905400-like isoform X1 n=1 Tax=Cymbidium sinense TaxID=112615 RepID=A0A5B8HAV3_9ASPA|nr:B3 domain-containing protein Os01g0905400-like isoform X1 [Cymbidium sinense]